MHEITKPDAGTYRLPRGVRWTAVVLAMLISVAACSGGTSSGSSSPADAPSSPSSTIVATSSTTAPVVTSSVPGTTLAGALLPDQVALPVMLFVGGVVYDLSGVPALEVIDIGQSSLPYAGSPVLTRYGLLVATGEAYDATLTLYPTNGGDPVELAHGVGSFAVSPDGRRLAWAEPTTTERDGDTDLVEVAFPSGQVLHTTTFSGFPFPDVDPPGDSPTS